MGSTHTATPLRVGQTMRPGGMAQTPTSALTNPENDDNSIQSGVSFNDLSGIRSRREHNRRRLQRMGILTGATFALFIYMLIPAAILFSMILFGTVSSVFFYQLADIARWEFQRTILEGRGISDYIPQGLFRTLTATSMHDFLSDPDGIFGASEHLPYIILYLIPGLTPEQLDQYVSRLSPTHQRLLRSEQGLLGFILNRNNHRLADGDSANSDSTLMRLLMGDEGLREWRQAQQHPDTQQHHTPPNIAPRRLELPPTIPESSEEDIPVTPTTRRLSAAPPSEQGGTNQPVTETPSAGIPETVAAIVGNRADTNNIPPAPASNSAQATARRPSLSSNQSPQRRTSISMDTVLLDAVRSAVSNVVSDATSSVRERAEQSFRDTLAVPIYRVSLGVTALGLGVGVFGLANGTYDLHSLTESIGQLVSGTIADLLGAGRSSQGSAPRVRLSFSMPSGGFLLGSTIASGTTAVVLGLFTGQRSGYSDSRAGRGPAAKPSGSEEASSNPQPI